MKDLYTFDTNEKGAMDTYDDVGRAYHRIFTRLGVPFAVVGSDACFLKEDSIFTREHRRKLIQERLAGVDHMSITSSLQVSAITRGTIQ